MKTEESAIPPLTCGDVKDGVLSLNSIASGKIVFRARRLKGYSYGAFEIEYSPDLTVEVDAGGPADEGTDKVWRLNKELFVEDDIGHTVRVFYSATPAGGEPAKSAYLAFTVEE